MVTIDALSATALLLILLRFNHNLALVLTAPQQLYALEALKLDQSLAIGGKII